MILLLILVVLTERSLLVERIDYNKRAPRDKSRGAPLLTASQSPEKSDDILRFAFRQADIKARVVERHRIVQSRCRAVVEIWSAGREAAQDRTFDLADIGPLAGDEGTAGIGRFQRLARGFIDQGIKGQVGGPARSIGQADVERHGDRVVADIGSIVAGGTSPVDQGRLQLVVETGDADDRDWLGIEKYLAAYD